MSEAIAVPAIEVDPASLGVSGKPATRQRVPHRFYVGMSGTLLLIVLIGFAPTLYLQPFFEISEGLRSAGQATYPAYLLVHGIVLTAWFVAFFVQTSLVAVRRTDIHRRLGWAVAGLAVAVLALNLMVTVAFAPRLSELGVDIEAGIVGLSRIVWANFAALLSFSLFLPIAVVLRHRPEMHKRLMLLASISIVQPALARIFRWPLFEGLDPVLLSLAGLFALLFALTLYDVISSKRLHPVTLVGGSFFFGSRLLALFVVADSEFGRSFVRGLE